MGDVLGYALGEDGQVHAVTRTDGRIRIDCGVLPLRSIGSELEVEKLGADRLCRRCFEEVFDD